MDPHLVSATLSPDDQQAINAAIDTLRQKLPFLIDLTTDQRTAMAKLGDKTQAFVQKAVEIANQHQQLFAAGFLDEMRKDAQLLTVLSPIQLAVNTLAKKLGDTTMQVGAEAYAAARTVYTVTKSPYAKAQMRIAADDLSKRFPSRKKAKAAAQPAAPPTSDPAPAPATEPATPTHT
jgi:hypothetical protein